jgi:hypothetical protein
VEVKARVRRAARKRDSMVIDGVGYAGGMDVGRDVLDPPRRHRVQRWD